MHKEFSPSSIKMTSTTLVLLLMCLGASHSVHLTKEIVFTTVPQSPQASQFSNIISHLLQPSEAIVSNLVNVLSSTIDPKVPDILDAVNSGLGHKLLIIADDAVQLDAVELEAALFKGAQDVSRALFPNDYIKQMATYAVMHNKALEIGIQLQNTIAANKIPVRQFEEILERRHFVMKRDIHKRDIITDFINEILKNMQTALCNTVLTEVKTFINSTLTNWIIGLQSIEVESTGDSISTILSATVEVGIFFIEQGLNCSNKWLENDANTICTSLLNSSIVIPSDTAVRKRRDVNETRTSVLQRDIITTLFGGVWGILWGLLSTVANPILKMAVSGCLTLLESILYSIIDSTFSPLL
ncbi:uncharacterized protein [Euwallacea similis]|uniref:uncharacterized protein n=1 Tax=Euwallacea similis TaxID=1736056 RepID=UPI00344FC729